VDSPDDAFSPRFGRRSLLDCRLFAVEGPLDRRPSVAAGFLVPSAYERV
jgi:hypothetical protein